MSLDTCAYAYGIDEPSRQTYGGTLNTGNSEQSPRDMGSGSVDD